MTTSRVIFERLTVFHLPLLWYYLGQKRDIAFFDNDGSAKKKSWVRKLLGEGRISAIPQIGYVYNDCYGTALDNLDKFYKYFTGSSVLVRETVKLYKDENIGLAYKKELTRQLAEFYYINAYLHGEASRPGENERIIFIPYRYKQFLKQANAGGAFYHRHDKIDFADCGLIMSSLHRLCRRIKTWLYHSGTTILFLANLFRGTGGQFKEYQYAIPITNPDYQLKFKSRSVDFLLDGKNINKDNTLFILLNPVITEDERAEIKNKNLNVMDCTGPFIRGFRAVKRLLPKALPYAVKTMVPGLFEAQLVLDVNNILLPVYFKWSAVLQRVGFKHLITLNDPGIDHVGRNILLHQSGVKTYYYAHSNSLGYLYLPADVDIAASRHWLWSFLYYDYYVAWNDELCKYYQLHPQQISNYVNIGCIWAQSIIDLSQGGTVPDLKRKAFPGDEPGKHKILSFFDSTYVPASVSPMEDGVAFYRAILRLLEELPDIRVIIKEKKSFDAVLQVYQGFGGSSDLFYNEYKPALEELSKHPRCCVTGYKGDPAAVIAMSDLTVTYAFSSSTVEALTAGKKALFYDPGNRFRGCNFDRIPGLMAHSYDELKQLVQKWLYETDDKAFQDFLNTYIKVNMDKYLDGKAVTRFQELLGGR